MAYPLRNRFRTGVTLAMFTLVVFTLVVGATTTTSFVNGLNDMGHLRGRFRRPGDRGADRIDRRHARRHQQAPGVDAADVRIVSAQSFLPVKAHQDGAPGGSSDYASAGSIPRSSPTRRTASRPARRATAQTQRCGAR